MDHSTHARLTRDELTDAVLSGAPVYGPGDEKIGTVAHVHGVGDEALAVIDVGGFLGIGAKPVGLPARDLDVMRDDAGTVHAVTRYSKDELKALPEHHD